MWTGSHLASAVPRHYVMTQILNYVTCVNYARMWFVQNLYLLIYVICPFVVCQSITIKLRSIAFSWFFYDINKRLMHNRVQVKDLSWLVNNVMTSRVVYILENNGITQVDRWCTGPSQASAAWWTHSCFQRMLRGIEPISYRMSSSRSHWRGLYIEGIFHSACRLFKCTSVIVTVTSSHDNDMI